MLRIPTTQEVYDRNIARLESALNQSSPATEKAFIKVLAAMEAMNYTELNRFGAERAKQNLAMTAGEGLLEVLGAEYGVTRKAAVAAQLDIEADANPGTEVPITASFTGDSNSEKYWPDASGSESGGKIELTVIAETAGIAGNLVEFDTMTIDDTIEGVDPIWTVTAVAVLGVEQEDLEAYRRRVLNEIRTVGGGGNPADYRTWAEETAGCYRAFPYSGAPIDTVIDFKDGDMELEGVSEWTAGNNANLTKETTSPQDGDRNLKIAYVDTANPYAYQEPLLLNHTYRITGYARSDGTFVPSVKNGSTVLWTGTASTNWQSFDVTFDADSVNISFYSDCDSSGYVEFDTVDIVQISYPGDRSVFVEADSDIDEDGIAPQSLLDDVRDNINTDPSTGKARPSLGDTDENLYIQSISRTELNVEIRDLSVSADIEDAVKADIETAVDEYLRGIAPFIEGLDPPMTQNDLITDLTLSQVIQDVLNAVGGSAAGIGLYIIPNSFIPSYVLGQGELSKLGTINYI